MLITVSYKSFLLCSSLLSTVHSLVPNNAFTFVGRKTVDSPAFSLSSSMQQQQSEEVESEQDPLGLTAELRKITDAFAMIGDDKLRYKQLLYMATNSLQPMSEQYKTDENKVPGCLSTVHVHATSKFDEETDKTLVYYEGDSDGLLTKGLVALLVRGLSGNTAEDIQKVDAGFIQEAQISQSLTPGRNNGFLNMLSTMKQQALKTSEETVSEDALDDSPTNDDGRPMYNAIVNTLQILKPVVLELEDESHKHAGHAGNDSTGGESHFNLLVVADVFDGLSLVKRHKVIYTLLGEVMPQIHALSIKALTEEEYNASQ